MCRYNLDIALIQYQVTLPKVNTHLAKHQHTKMGIGGSVVDLGCSESEILGEKCRVGGCYRPMHTLLVTCLATSTFESNHVVFPSRKRRLVKVKAPPRLRLTPYD